MWDTVLGSRNTTVKQTDISCPQGTCVLLVDTDQEVVQYDMG